MKELLVVVSFIPLTFSALLPVINPIGSAVLFLGFVQNTDHTTKKKLARKIALNTVLFLFLFSSQALPSYVSLEFRCRLSKCLEALCSRRWGGPC